MAEKPQIHCATMHVAQSSIGHNARIKKYPDGSMEILACESSIFGFAGWENERRKARRAPTVEERDAPSDGAERSVRRAKAQVKDLALCTKFKYFVTLTLDGDKINRYDIKAVTKKLNTWLDNAVRRQGLAYVLVPELHKDGAIHFHGFFNDSLPVSDSGTIIPPDGKKPRKPRSKVQREDWLSKGGKIVYNLPKWGFGFSTAIELYGDYHRAVAYVCKYIGKEMDGEKIGGRWYYSGGELGHPDVSYFDCSVEEIAELEGAYRFTIPDAGMGFAMVTLKGGETNVRDSKGEANFRD